MNIYDLNKKLKERQNKLFSKERYGTEADYINNCDVPVHAKYNNNNNTVLFFNYINELILIIDNNTNRIKTNNQFNAVDGEFLNIVIPFLQSDKSNRIKDRKYNLIIGSNYKNNFISKYIKIDDCKPYIAISAIEDGTGFKIEKADADDLKKDEFKFKNDDMDEIIKLCNATVKIQRAE